MSSMKILAYADNVVILGNSRQEVIHTMKKLIKSSRNMGLKINEAKSKYMLMTRHMPIKKNLTVGPHTYEQVDDFKYLRVNIIYRNDMHNEVKLSYKLESRLIEHISHIINY